MSNILIATEKPFAPVAVNQMRNIIEQAGHKVILLEKYTEKSQLTEAAQDADAIIFRSDIIDREVLAKAQNLKIAVRAGAGYDNIDLAAATEKGVVVMNTPGQNSNAVAELSICLMIFMARKMLNGSDGTELRDKKLGIHAFGYIGKLVAQMAKGFGMEVYAYDPFITDDHIKLEGVKPVASVEELYKTCQYISLHIPATNETKKSINAQLLATMPKGGTLINTARKEVIDEDGLLEAMAGRGDLKYATDIAPACDQQLKEKYPDRYFATPKKMGAQTAEANVNAGLAAANQIVKYLKTGDTTFQVNK
jgi:D-3-phosphoglycerate dehydrogenase / 2-oxoglutarate reductase